MADNVALEVAYFSDRPSEGKRFSHSYSEEWARTGLFCPRCGEQEVWQDTSDGDYYVGNQHICAACEGGFHLPGGVMSAADDQDAKRLSAIRAADKPRK